jgi:hypothetical protein
MQNDDQVPIGVLILGSLFLAYVFVYCTRMWMKFGRMALQDRYRYRERFKSEIFLLSPWLYLVGAGIAAGSIVVSWSFAL